MDAQARPALTHTPHGGSRDLDPARVLELIDEPVRRGFVYGTLPGHPERGEEAFLVTIDDDGTVRVIVQGFSRPGPGIWTLGSPALRLVQAIYTRRYLRALR